MKRNWRKRQSRFYALALGTGKQPPYDKELWGRFRTAEEAMEELPRMGGHVVEVEETERWKIHDYSDPHWKFDKETGKWNFTKWAHVLSRESFRRAGGIDALLEHSLRFKGSFVNRKDITSHEWFPTFGQAKAYIESHRFDFDRAAIR